MSGVKGIIGMHRFNICLVVVLSLSCSGVKTPLVWLRAKKYCLRAKILFVRKEMLVCVKAFYFIAGKQKPLTTLNHGI